MKNRQHKIWSISIIPNCLRNPIEKKSFLSQKNIETKK